ncbi:MAG TPA: hypothetical protein VH834_24095 [Solirubrobacteraceae bacterium]|jgi:hypothetical protein
MSYATAAPPAIRLGLRARVRAVREARMVSERSRRRLAEALEQGVARATRRRPGLTAVVPVSPDALGDARGALLDLAERLRAPRPVDADGMRLARALLIDGSGPLYVPGTPGALRKAAVRALGALDGARR